MRQPALICYFASGGQFSIERPQERVEFAVALWRDPGSHAHHTGGEGEGIKLVVLLAGPHMYACPRGRHKDFHLRTPRHTRREAGGHPQGDPGPLGLVATPTS